MDIEGWMIDELRQGAMTAIDGLWFLAAQESLGFEGALELDIKVWKQYGQIMLKRAARLLGLDLDAANPPDLETVTELLDVLCQIDGTECASDVVSADRANFTVRRCTWWENLKKAGRDTEVPCDIVDNATFESWLAAVDPSLGMKLMKSLPGGDECCQWVIWRRPGPETQ